jgi:hypothetical protein
MPHGAIVLPYQRVVVGDGPRHEVEVDIETRSSGSNQCLI